MKFPLAERFKAPQGEGQYAGTMMAFVRTVGCSVGQSVCTKCDTDFDKLYPHLGGGIYTAAELIEWAAPCTHLCLTGGEPLDRDIRELLVAARLAGMQSHVETSGTVKPNWLTWERGTYGGERLVVEGDAAGFRPDDLWLTVSPKPGYREDMILMADEVKVIIGGLGDGPGWPTVEDAVRWADDGKLVYVQPRNERLDIDRHALADAIACVELYPQLRLSTQLHKFIRTR